MEKLFWKNGEIFSDGSLIISCHDLGLIRGYGVFDFFRTYGKTPFELEAHIDRLFYSCKEIDLNIPYTKEALSEAVVRLIECHSKENLGIKIYVTAGESLDAFTASDHPTVWMVAAPLHQPKSPLSLKSVAITREIPQIKSLNYLSCSLWTKRVQKLGFDDIIYKDQGGFLLESSTSNLFFIKGDELITAEENILHGITRKVVVDLAKDDFTITKRAIHESELPAMDECFLTSTTREICPVDVVDRNTFNSSYLESKTNLLRSRFQLLTRTSALLKN